MKDEQARQELDDARRELEQKKNSMMHNAENLDSVYVGQKAKLEKRVKNVTPEKTCVVQ